VFIRESIATQVYCDRLSWDRLTFWYFLALPDTDIQIQNLPKDYLCSSCYLNLLQALQKSPFSNYDESWQDDYVAAQTGESGQFIS